VTATSPGLESGTVSFDVQPLELEAKTAAAVTGPPN